MTKTKILDNPTYRISIFSIISFLFLLLYTHASSPLTNYFGADYDMFVMGGEFLKRGELYTGNFDHKGPYLFAINALGLFISSGKWGIFILEVISFTISIELLYRISAVYTSSKKIFKLGLVVFLFILGLFVLEDANSSEFWSLNLVLWPLLLISKYITQNGTTHPAKYAFIYGICFGIIAFIRLNNTAIICGIITGLAYLLIIRKQYKSLFNNAIACLLGIITAIMPACLYFMVKGSFEEMIDCTFTFNFMYMGHDKSPEVINYIKTILPCIILSVAGYKYDKYEKKNSMPFIISMCIFSILSIGGRFYPHYFTLLTPLIFLSIIIYPLSNKPLKRKILELGTITILAIIPYMGKRPVRNSAREFIFPLRIIANKDFQEAYGGNSNYLTIQKIFEDIPESSRDSIYQYELPYYFYAMTYRAGHMPVGRYPSMQENYNEIWGNSKKNDIVEQFTKAKPHYIISGKDLNDKKCVIKDYINTYTCIDTIYNNKNNNKIFLYKRNDINQTKP